MAAIRLLTSSLWSKILITDGSIWDGKNAVGEPIANGVYFYTLTADDFTGNAQDVNTKVRFSAFTLSVSLRLSVRIS